MSDHDKLVKPRRGLSAEEWKAEAFRLMALVTKDRAAADAMLAELLGSDPATWLEPLSRNPAVQTAAMIQALALAARPPRTMPLADPDQVLAVAEALASITPDGFGKVSALQELWISRGLLCRERGDYPAALAALDRAALLVESPSHGLLEQSEILFLKAQVHLDARDYRAALASLFESGRDSDEETGKEERLALLWKIVEAIKASD